MKKYYTIEKQFLDMYSGDFCGYETEEPVFTSYKKARKYLTGIKHNMGLLDRYLIISGYGKTEHDVDWDTTEYLYRKKK